ncbi:NADH-quinone oxidoreductase subunit J family protein [Pedosphaera parvula]|uniref:NADH-quinone oxidoreductase subunit J n=1 Tax=Pedosphaera parvula (strain Ellin514) TaxID=320771 RepID=B9XFX5_PEDPL|nr:NADH-quinone oxidoreductase subunit J [Pedosphaera parvula]EEF61137.1 NADH-ubiquinone/plastoquinone oxidoreductase chain 6 [Pedosphaera parvula Ellin514]
MRITFAIIAALTLVSGIAAMSLRNLVHCALSLAITFAGLAAMYLQLDAQFVGFAQILVYIGAVAILIVFAILLTRSSEAPQPVISRSWIVGIAIAVAVFGVMIRLIASSPIAQRGWPEKPGPTVKQIGDQLMTRFVLPLEAMGLLLTVATIGAVIIAMNEKTKAGLQLRGNDSHPVPGTTPQSELMKDLKT